MRCVILMVLGLFVAACGETNNNNKSVRKCENPGVTTPGFEEAKDSFEDHVLSLSKLTYIPADRWVIKSRDSIDIDGASFTILETGKNNWKISDGTDEVGYLFISKHTYEERLETRECSFYRINIKSGDLEGYATYPRL